MKRQILHLMRKDLWEHRSWYGLFLGLAAARGLLVGSGIDAHVSNQTLLTSLTLGYVVLTVLHGALMAALTVQLVQGDRLVGTTAFWLTRPVRRADLVVAKIAGAFVALVVVPVLLGVLVMVVNDISWRDATIAAAEDAGVRLSVVLPVMALASVTADLGGFVLSAVAALVAGLTVEAVFQWGPLTTAWRSIESAYSATIVVAAVLVAGMGAAFAHQVARRRRRLTAVLLCVIGLAGLLVAHRWKTDFVSPAGGVEAGWLEPSKVSMTLTPTPPGELRRLPGVHPWKVQASFAFAGVPPSVALAPVQLNSVAVFPDGRKVTTGGPSPGGALPWRALWRAHVYGRPAIESLLGGVRLLIPPEVPREEATRLLASLTDEDVREYARQAVRFDVEATLGAVGYRIGSVLPLDGRAAGAAGGERFRILSATCTEGTCTVVVRDATTSFLMDYGRQSRVVFILVNTHRHQALMVSERTAPRGVPVFGPMPILTERLMVTHRHLVFEAPKDTPEIIDTGWQTEAAIAAVEMRDLGTFKVRAVVDHRP